MKLKTFVLTLGEKKFISLIDLGLLAISEKKFRQKI